MEKIMQKALTHVNSSENDCFADYAVEVAEETGTPLSSVSKGGRPRCSLRFANDIDLIGNNKKNTTHSNTEGNSG